MKGTIKRTKTPAASEPSGRPGGSSVPAPARSTSCDRLQEGLPARPSCESVSARATGEERVKRKAAMTAARAKRRARLGDMPPSAWRPSVFPPFGDINLRSETEYNCWAWYWEKDAEQVEKLIRGKIIERTDEDWVERELHWIRYAEEMEEIEEDYLALQKERQKLRKDLEKMEREKKELEKRELERTEKEPRKEHRDRGVQVEEDVRPGAESMDFGSDPGRDMIGELERRLERVVCTVSTLGQSMDSLGARLAKEIREVGDVVRRLRASPGSPLSIPLPRKERDLLPSVGGVATVGDGSMKGEG